MNSEHKGKVYVGEVRGLWVFETEPTFVAQANRLTGHPPASASCT